MKYSRDEYFEVHGRNCEGYRDSTYHKAVYGLSGEHSRRYKLIGILRGAAELAGFEIVGRVTLKDKMTGKILD